MTHRAFVSITATALIALASPAAAQSQAPLANQSGESVSAGGGQSADPNRRICVLQETTGSRLRSKVCRTRAQWEQDGGVPQEESR